MKKNIKTLLLVFMCVYLNAQSLSSLDSDLNNYVIQIRHAFNNKITVDELEDEIEDLQRKISYLK